jgi:predicted metal-binding membrane protein
MAAGGAGGSLFADRSLTMTRSIAALAALSLVAAPVAAQAARTAAPVEHAESLAGGTTVAWVIAALMVIGVVWAVVDDDDDSDLPVSP